MLPETAVLRGRFIADNHVDAIRLNGQELPVPEHASGVTPFDWFTAFSAGKGFVEGANVLEIDVLNPPTGATNKARCRCASNWRDLSLRESTAKGGYSRQLTKLTVSPGPHCRTIREGSDQNGVQYECISSAFQPFFSFLEV